MKRVLTILAIVIVSVSLGQLNSLIVRGEFGYTSHWNEELHSLFVWHNGKILDCKYFEQQPTDLEVTAFINETKEIK